MYLLKSLAAADLSAKPAPSTPRITQPPTKVQKTNFLHATPPITATAWLKGQPQTVEDEGARTIGGLRSTACAMRKIAGHAKVGRQLAPLIRAMVNDVPHLKETALKSLARQPYDEAELESLIHDCRTVVAKALGLTDIPTAVGPIANKECSTCLRAHLLKAWAMKAGDPAAPAADWLISGAPAGIETADPCLDMLWPRKDDEATPLERGDYHDDTEIQNSRDPAVDDLLNSYEKKGYVQICTSAQQLHQ